MSGSRSVQFSTSPLLASKTPVWRSKFIVAAMALGFLGLVGRAAYVQVFNNAFFQRQGEVRYARTLVLPPRRGKIVDFKRAGAQHLGQSGRVGARSIQAGGVGKAAGYERLGAG